jgi:formyltetrahydrofolate-dependent phosphoribosylglycinamide formyltransferase
MPRTEVDVERRDHPSLETGHSLSDSESMSKPAYSPMTPEQVRELRDSLEKQGKKLVFTNGCFDLLHAGHVRYLNQARALGDAMVVALNSDASVRKLKGPTRPINRERDRAEVMAALRAVDAVVIFGDKRATSLIQTIRPHIYAKGGDYTPESLDPEERGALKEVGAEIQILSLVAGRSTTRIVERMTNPADNSKPLKLGVLGSGVGSNLQAIIDAIHEGSLDAEIAVAISDQAESNFLKIARAEGIEAQHVDGGEGKKFAEQAQKRVAELLQQAQVDVVVLVGFMRILKEPVINLYADRLVNVHPSLLPKFKGAHAVQEALDEGELETGCTVHLVTAEIDAGRILAQTKVPILVGDDAETLHARIKKAEHKLLPKVLSEWKR